MMFLSTCKSQGLRALVMCTLAITSGVLFAQDEIDYSEMSLEDLLNVEVVTASKSAESAQDAPGIITVITAREIKEFGANTLRDVLERAPSFQPIWNAFSGNNGINVRGDRSTIDDNHILVLVNGRPIVRNSWDGGGHATLYQLFPIDLIERIEIVRGPGSVLYGSNAFQGVVNIITKKGEENHMEISAKAGSFGTSSIDALATYSQGDFAFNAGLYINEEDGYDFEMIGEDLQPIDTEAFNEDNVGFVSTIDYKGLSLNLNYLNKKALSMTPSVAGLFGWIDQNVIAANISYGWSINENWKVEANASVSSRRYDFVFLEDQTVFDINTDDYLYEITVHGALSDKANIVFGALNNDLSGESPFGGIDWDFTWAGGYVQFDYRFSDKVKVIAGGQYNKPTDVDGRFSPRFGAIFKFNEKSGIKILGGEAFRSPVADELKLEDPASGLFADPNTEPELVFTTDLQFFYNLEGVQWAATLYQNDQENLIGIYPANDGTGNNIIGNLPEGDRKIRGLELETKIVPNENVYISGSITFQENESASGADDVTLQPNVMAKLGVSYSKKDWSIGVYNSYFEAYKEIETALQVNPKSDDINLLSANFRYNPKSILDGGLSFVLYGTNILDEDIWVPDINAGVINTVPGAGGSAYYGKIHFRF